MNKALPKRKHARLKCYDYATPGVYFITICARDRKCVFSKIVTDENEQVANDYTEFGKIAERNLLALEQRFTNLRIDKYVIMPNHIHALFVLTDCDSEAAGASPRPTGVTRNVRFYGNRMRFHLCRFSIVSFSSLESPSSGAILFIFHSLPRDCHAETSPFSRNNIICL